MMGDIVKVANVLMLYSSIFGISLEEAWSEHMQDFPTGHLTFSDVKKHIDDKVALGEKFQKEFGGL